MTEPRRLKDLSTALPLALSQALKGAPEGPTELEQRALLQSLGSTLGITLALPSGAAKLAAASSASSAVNITANLGARASTAVGLAAKPGISSLIWLGGGLALGTVLSATALFSAQLLSPQPSSSKLAAPSVSSATRSARAPAMTASAASAFTSPELDAGTPAARPTPESAPRPPMRKPARERQVTETDTEFSLLRRAQQLLRTDPQRALDLCAAHSAQFSAAGMVQEREMIAIEALLRLRRIQEANARASTFVRLFPHSAHTSRLEQLLQRSKF